MCQIIRNGLVIKMRKHTPPPEDMRRLGITPEEYEKAMETRQTQIDFWSNFWSAQESIIEVFEGGEINFRELQQLLGLRFVRAE